MQTVLFSLISWISNSLAPIVHVMSILLRSFFDKESQKSFCLGRHKPHEALSYLYCSIESKIGCVCFYAVCGGSEQEGWRVGDRDEK